MNEAETRAELIDPKLKAADWGVAEGSKVLREFGLTRGKIQTGGGRAKPLIADYVLEPRAQAGGHQAKRNPVGGCGAGQRPPIRCVGSPFSQWQEIYQIGMRDGEGLVSSFRRRKRFGAWLLLNRMRREKFDRVPSRTSAHQNPLLSGGRGQQGHEAIADGRQRVLLTTATAPAKPSSPSRSPELFHTAGTCSAMARSAKVGGSQHF